MDAAGFISEFSEFARTNPVVITAKLQEATRFMGTDGTWGPFGTTSMASTYADDAQKWYTAHLISQMPLGQSTRLKPNEAKTTYLQQYERLRDALTSDFVAVSGGIGSAVGGIGVCGRFYR